VVRPLPGTQAPLLTKVSLPPKQNVNGTVNGNGTANGNGTMAHSASASNVSPSTSQASDPATVKSMALELLNTDPEFRKQVETALGRNSQPQNAEPVGPTPLNVNVDQLLAKEFTGGKITPFNTQDMQGTVFGWPEEIWAKVVQHNNEIWVVPLYFQGGTGKIDRADVAVMLRVAQLYESMNRFTISQRPKVVVIGRSLTDSANKIATQIGIKFLQVQ